MTLKSNPKAQVHITISLFFLCIASRPSPPDHSGTPAPFNIFCFLTTVLLLPSRLVYIHLYTCMPIKWRTMFITFETYDKYRGSI